MSSAYLSVFFPWVYAMKVPKAKVSTIDSINIGPREKTLFRSKYDNVSMGMKLQIYAPIQINGFCFVWKFSFI